MNKRSVLVQHCVGGILRLQKDILLTLLDDKESIPLLQNVSRNERVSRSVRLSASLALAGMGATVESSEDYQQIRLYAFS